MDTAGAAGAGSAANAAAAVVGEADDADDEAPAAAASGKRSRAPLLVGCFFCCRVRCIKHSTGGDARVYPPDVHAFGREKYRRGAWWCDECNTAMQLPLQYWSPEEVSQQHAEKVAAAAKRKAGKAERDGTKEARQHSPYEE